ncbi:HD domain-containing protein [Actinokineospora fastidiosa]|uniref:HD domain-containing protein n=1 Tax=Actinokineospora fastidiosa TaxID=1816 RepID=A0A918GE25_9PSEU|nr:HD domain-containing protein [Actinokineospora fastidiosa]GGS30735.1 hypothetical protein GCM10010171_25430 [Actinokineospora fastidiosa]
MFTEADAVRIAREAHDGQVDKSGRPYIGHPLRVMAAVDGQHERMAAVLHDVIEDTPVTADDLRAAGCPDEVVTAVVALSKVDGEDQDAYLARVAANPLAVTVKRADIADKHRTRPHGGAGPGHPGPAGRQVRRRARLPRHPRLTWTSSGR